MLWMSTRKCGFIKNFVRAMAVLSILKSKNRQAKLDILNIRNVLERLRIAPDSIFETLHEHSYYLKDAEYGHYLHFGSYRLLHIIYEQIAALTSGLFISSIILSVMPNL